MVIKRAIVFITLLLIMNSYSTAEFLSMPLHRPTLFSCMLDATLELWSEKVDGVEPAPLEAKLKELFILSTLLVYQHEVLSAGNIEYLLSIFDVLEGGTACQKALCVIRAIKKELIALL